MSIEARWKKFWSRSHRRHLALSTVLATFVVSLGLSATALPAQADGLCTTPLFNSNSWVNSVARQPDSAGVQIEVWNNGGGYMLGRVRNAAANGKTNVVTESGTVTQGNDLGTSRNIGAAPSGGWCGNWTNQGGLWVAVGWDIGATHYYQYISCLGRNGGYRWSKNNVWQIGEIPVTCE
jgi:hypothetical protein